MIAEGDCCAEVPLEQLRQILVVSSAVRLSSGLLSLLARAHVDVVFCDRKFRPSCEIMPIALHAEASGHILDQSEWREERRNAVWAEIVRMKILNQRRLLRILDIEAPAQLRQYAEGVKPGDPDNREGLAARLYFPALFGREVRRHARDGTNAALDYGYAILCSLFSRLLALHGYHTGLGVHHRSRDNPVNLSCDLMEPFRPAADRIAWEAEGARLSWETKKRMIALPYADCRLDGKHMPLGTAAESFLLEAVKAAGEGGALPEVRFD